MPLPDERPRQSVANLIGRFETQQKRAAKSEAPKPIQLPGKTLSGLQDRKASLGPELANNLARNATSLSRTPPESVPGTVIEPQAVEPTISIEPAVVRVEEQTGSPSMPEAAVPTSVEASQPVVSATQPPLEESKSISPSSSRVSTLKTTKVRPPPQPSSMPMTKSRSASQQQKSATDASSVRPRQAASTSVRGAVSPVPRYMAPLRPQQTGLTASEGKVRAKTPVTKQPRTGTTNGHTTTPTPSSSHLMAPTASSLAKARPPVAAAARSNNATTMTPTKKAGTTSAATKADDPATHAPQTSARQRTISSVVPFPSARRAKTTTGPASTTKSKAGATLSASQSASSRRQSRISQSSSKGPSAAALAALAKVNAPPVPTIPTSATAGAESKEAQVPRADDVVVASSTDHGFPNFEKSVAVSALASNSRDQIRGTEGDTTTVVEPIVDDKVLTPDSSEGAPSAEPLTEEVPQALDSLMEGVSTKEVNGGVAVKSGDAQRYEDDDKLNTSSGSVPSSPVLHQQQQHGVHVVPPTPTSPTMDRDHGHQSVDPVLSSGSFDDDELKDDAYLTDKSGKTGDIPDS